MARALRIGVAACFFHADPQRAIFKGKTLLYLEASMGHYLMRHGAFPVLLPQAHGAFEVSDLLDGLDGLLLQGGSDVAPTSYGEVPLRPEWGGDAIRDAYEIELIGHALQQGLPILGICRGAQIINVALGGTMFQDIELQHPEHLVHRDWQVYDQLSHDVRLVPGGTLAGLYSEANSRRVNSVHHQGVKELGKHLLADAFSEPDGVIEALRYYEEGREVQPFVFGVQWHPEFQSPSQNDLLSPEPIMTYFLNAVRARISKERAL